LSSVELERWQSQLEWVQISLGEIFYASEESPTYAYFPTTEVVSVLTDVKNGASSAIAVVGNAGNAGMSLARGVGFTIGRAVVHRSGFAYRVQAQVLIDDVNRYRPVLGLLLRCAQALMTQIDQTAVCNRHHTLDQQLCRWLLLNLNQSNDHELHMTQELIVNMLGVRCESVTDSAIKLQNAALICYCRGHIRTLNRAALDARSCECYRVVEDEYKRLFPPNAG
jgi:hypothetical protein